MDTCLSGGGAALADGGRVLAQALLEPGPGFSRRLLPAMEQVMIQAGAASRRDLTGLAVTIGPGFFTGLRVALATAQGLALGLNLPVAGVSSLRLLAEAAPAGKRTVWALADARRDLLYAACFEQDGDSFQRREADMAITPELLTAFARPPRPCFWAPARACLDPADLAPRPGSGPGLLRPAQPRPLGPHRRPAAWPRAKGLSPHQLRPRYCRPSDAEVRFGLPMDDYRLVQ